MSFQMRRSFLLLYCITILLLKGSVICYNDKMVNFGCFPVKPMDVSKGDHDNFNKNGVFDGSATANATCSIITNCKVKSHGKETKLGELNLLLQKYCSNISTRTYPKNTSVDDLSCITSITSTGENPKLHKVNEGYIEIKDGPIGKKVADKSWDKDHQKMLCQHLGFDVTDKNELSNRESGRNEDIATGDLIFYYTQSGGISMCGAMEGSNTGHTVTYVTLKICDNPLCRNHTLFSDTVNDGGWCSRWKNGTTYLMIDLQKEYHISQVVTTCGEDQRRCGGSYSLQYSHNNKTLVNGSSVEKVLITRNQSGYGASFTNVSIYNARYIKIVTGKRDFCPRIELCGEVQTPAPVQKITVSPSSFSALVSWTLLGHDKSSYITEYAVRLNGVDLPRISRKMYENKYTVTNLTPNTRYTFEIRTLDGSLQQSSTVTKNFTTTNAGSIVPGIVGPREGDNDSGGDGGGVFGTAVGHIVGLTIGVVIMVALAIAVIFFRRKRKHDRYAEEVVDNVIREEENDVKPDIQPFNDNDGIYSSETDSIQQPADEYEFVERFQGQREASYVSVDGIYASPYEVFGADNFAKQEASAYMSMNDSQEPGNLYQPQQDLGKISDQETAVDNVIREEENDVRPDIQPFKGNDGIYSNETDSIQQPADEYELVAERLQDQREASYMSVDGIYARPYETFGAENFAKPEAAYICMNDSRHPGNLCQPRQDPGKISDRDSIQQPADEYELLERFQDRREALYMNVDCTYARSNEAFSAENSAKEEASAYMSLKDGRESGSLYEPLQHSGKISDPTKGGER